MSYTTDDLALVRQAKLDLAAGRRVLQVRSANGKTLVYQGASKADLDDLEAEIKTSLAQAKTNKPRRTRHILTGKGL